MDKKHTFNAIKARIERLADIIDVAQLDLEMIGCARSLCHDYYDTTWPTDTEKSLRLGLYDHLFALGYRIDPGAGPLSELARRLRATVQLIEPSRVSDTGADSGVMTPAEAASYLGLDRLGVNNPEARIHYLVKTKRLRRIRILASYRISTVGP